MNTSLMNLDGLSQPATTLIERVSDAVGGIAKPWQTKRVAKAEAEAKIIHAEADAKVAFINTQAGIDISDIQRRALDRMVYEEGKNQENIENITYQSLSFLNDNAKPEDLSEDWLRYFFERGRLVSDEDMQTVWAKILAEEANIPKSFSKKTLDLMSSLDKTDAELFTSLCKFNWKLGKDLTPVVIDEQNDIYGKNGINFMSLSHLNYLGLINFNSIGGFNRELRHPIPSICLVSYYNTIVLIEPISGIIQIGKVLLTKAGQELALICGSQPSDEFLDYILKNWSSMNARKE